MDIEETNIEISKKIDLQDGKLKSHVEATRSKNFMIENILSSPSQNCSKIETKNPQWQWRPESETDQIFDSNKFGVNAGFGRNDSGFCGESSRQEKEFELGNDVTNGQGIQEVGSTSSEECNPKFDGEKNIIFLCVYRKLYSAI